MGTRGTSSLLYILTREINCREEEEKTDVRRIKRDGDGDGDEERRDEHPARRAERKELKENTGKMNWQHGERQ